VDCKGSDSRREHRDGRHSCSSRASKSSNQDSAKLEEYAGGCSSDSRVDRLLASAYLGCVAGLWWFYRSHADLGAYWSVTLEVRENHRLITHGTYRLVRHPMYSALFLCAIGQALVLPNWVAGPSYLLALVILFAFRVGAEEKMMLETFGNEYAAYMTKTKRLVPRLW